MIGLLEVIEALGHAIEAAKITFVRDRQAHILNLATKWVDKSFVITLLAACHNVSFVAALYRAVVCQSYDLYQAVKPSNIRIIHTLLRIK